MEKTKVEREMAKRCSCASRVLKSLLSAPLDVASGVDCVDIDYKRQMNWIKQLRLVEWKNVEGELHVRELELAQLQAAGVLRPKSEELSGLLNPLPFHRILPKPSDTSLLACRTRGVNTFLAPSTCRTWRCDEPSHPARIYSICAHGDLARNRGKRCPRRNDELRNDGR